MRPGSIQPSDGVRSSADLVAGDLRHVWHPFTQQATWADEEPLVIASGEGRYLVDRDGRRYLDGVSSLWAIVHGHREPALDAAVRDQLDRVAHSTFLGLTHEPGIALAEELLATAPAGLTRVFYAGDGSSAVEAALKIAFQASAQRGRARPLYVHVADGYHGDTLGAVSVGGVSLFHETYRPILLRTRQISSPGRRAPGQSPAARAAEVVAELAGLLGWCGADVCAVVIEPLIQAAGGMLTHHPDFVAGVRALCDESGAALITDEVATGIGRTGAMWAVQHADIRPDLLTCGKGLTGGYLPLSAVLATEEMYAVFLGTPESGRTFFHGHTYTANPLACSVARANLALMAERGTVARAAAIGERIGAGLAPLSGVVAEVRRCGTMTGIDLGGGPGRPGAGRAVCRLARERGVLIRPLGDVVVLMPPLGSTDSEIDELTSVVVGAVIDTLDDLVASSG